MQLASHHFIKMAMHPAVQLVPVEQLVSKYGATFFGTVFSRFVVLRQNPQMTRIRLECNILDLHIPSINISVYYGIQFQDKSLNDETVDSIHVQPAWKDKRGRPIAGHFDTCLIHCRDGRTRIHGEPSIAFKVQ